MSRPIVTIITPTFNHQTVIKTCLESVVNQTFDAWEQIVIDDGSDDNTWDIVQGCSAKCPKIIPIRSGHRGIWNLAELYNLALQRSSGNYVAILEGDDWWPSNKLELQIPIHLDDNNILLSYGVAGIMENTELKTMSLRPPFSTLTVTTSEFLKHLISLETYYEPVTVMMQKEALLSIGGFQQIANFPAVDFPTFVALCKMPGTIAWLDECLGYYRQHAEQVTKSLGVEIAEGRYQIALGEFKATGDLFDKEEIAAAIRAHHRSLSDAYLAAVRYALIQHNAHNLDGLTRKLWTYGGVKRKLEAVYARIAVKQGWTLEPLLEVARTLSRR
jgi:glycosyltransferase involved in cell wall biosynthesis